MTTFVLGPRKWAEDYVFEHGRKVSEIMTRALVTVAEDAPLTTVVELLLRDIRLLLAVVALDWKRARVNRTLRNRPPAASASVALGSCEYSLKRQEQLHAANDANDPRISENHDLRYLMTVHFGNDLVHSRAFVDANGLAAHHSVDAQGPGSLSDQPPLLFAKQPFEPEALWTMHAELATVKEIPFGDNTDQRP